MSALGNGAAKLVRARLLNNYRSEDTTSVWGLWSDIGSEVADAKLGDAIDLPYVAEGSITVNADGSQDATADNLTVSARQLVVDREPLVLVRLNRRHQAQLLKGEWTKEVSNLAIGEMDNHLDRDLLDFAMSEAAGSGSQSTTPSTVVNAAGVTLTSDHFLEARTRALDSRGRGRRRLALVLDIWHEAIIHTLPGFTGVQLPAGGSPDRLALGFTFVGTFHGMPVFLTNENPGSSPRQAISSQAFSVATSASVISGTGTVQTLTVSAGHRIVPGMVGTTAGLTSANGHNGSGRVVTGVTDTSITLQITGGTDNTAADGVGTFTPRSAFSFLMDLGRCYRGMADDMQIAFVDLPTNTGMNMKVSPLIGRQCEPGAIIAIGGPRGSLTQA